jgi:hypothetical protein
MKATKFYFFIGDNPVWRMASSWMLRRVALVRIDVSEELEALSSSETSVLTRATSQKSQFFIVTAVKSSNLTTP